MGSHRLQKLLGQSLDSAQNNLKNQNFVKFWIKIWIKMYLRNFLDEIENFENSRRRLQFFGIGRKFYQKNFREN